MQKKEKLNVYFYINLVLLGFLIIGGFLMFYFVTALDAGTRVLFLLISIIALGFMIYSFFKKKNTWLATTLLLLASIFL